jgi:hypothetical protein
LWTLDTRVGSASAFKGTQHTSVMVKTVSLLSDAPI